jgi:hypothetical protein
MLTGTPEQIQAGPLVCSQDDEKHGLTRLEELEDKTTNSPAYVEELKMHASVPYRQVSRHLLHTMFKFKLQAPHACIDRPRALGAAPHVLGC